MRTMLAVLICMLAVTLAVSPIAGAQSDVDVPAVAQTVTGVDPDALLAALHQPMANDDLPAQFSDATYVEQETQASDAIAGAVTYTLTYMPGPEASPSPQASPVQRGPERIFNLASVQYLVFDHELDAAALEQFDDVLRGFIGDQAANADVETITVQDAPAYRISIETETNGIPIIIEWVAIPVGTVAVMSMTMTSGETIDIASLQADAEVLAIASVGHLGSAVEHRTTPAG